jgi:hypothetical protein
MERKIMKQLRSDYEKLEIKPSADLWDKLDQKLGETPEMVSKISFQWWKYAAVVLLLISVGSFIYFNINKNNFDPKKTDYIVKKGLKNTINLEFKTQPVISSDEAIKENEVKIVSENQKINYKESFTPKKEREIIQRQISEFKTSQIAIKQPENIEIKMVKIENKNPTLPVIAEVKKTKSSYINANELLLGREFDKTRENPYKNEVKLGVFNLDKAVPNVDNVTVLGVTVYIDSK